MAPELGGWGRRCGKPPVIAAANPFDPERLDF
jgi:hypothetical protein